MDYTIPVVVLVVGLSVREGFAGARAEKTRTLHSFLKRPDLLIAVIIL
jgi:hypothetical protein